MTRSAVARRAGVSVVFLRSHPDLVQTIEEAEQRHRLTPPESTADKGKDHVIAALRRRLDELKQALAAKDGELRQKQREIDHLYGKLAAGLNYPRSTLPNFPVCHLARSQVALSHPHPTP